MPFPQSRAIREIDRRQNRSPVAKKREWPPRANSGDPRGIVDGITKRYPIAL
jgi:hypothetical protein